MPPSNSAHNHLYQQYLGQNEASFRTVDIKKPVFVSDGTILEGSEVGDIPIHAAEGRALQIISEVQEYSDTMLETLSGAYFSVGYIAEAVRHGRVRLPSDSFAALMPTMEHAFVGHTRSYQNFYHWLVETVPKAMRLHQDFKPTQILTHVTKLPFHADFPALADIPSLITAPKHVFMKRATTVSLSTSFAPEPKLSRFAIPADDTLIFPRVLKPNIQGKTRRVFISRRDVSTRLLNDEVELVKELEARGFDCPVMSELSLREQAELCGSAEIIISTHGAGLSNGLFQTTPAKIVEIIPLKRWRYENLMCIYNLSCLVGHQHYLFDCKYKNEDAPLLSQNWSINHRHFLRFIDTILN